MRLELFPQVLLLLAALAVQGTANAIGDSPNVPYLECVETAVARGHSPDDCCFFISSRTAMDPPHLKNCEPPFGFCHKHTVGYSFDKPGNFDVAAGGSSVAFYRCGGYHEPCGEVCTNPSYAPIMANSGQARTGEACLPFEFDRETMLQYLLTLRRWEISASPGAPL